MQNEIVSIKEAKRRGLKFYFSGNPCSKCKTRSKRYVSNSKCRFCHANVKTWDISFTDCEAQSTWRGKNPRTFNYNKFGIDGTAKCQKHGVHSNWASSINTKNHKKYLICKLCKSEYNKRHREQNPIKYIFRYCHNRGFEVNIVEQDIKDKLEEQKNICALSGIKFTNVFRPSLDRIDSSKGYVKGNIQLVLHEINTMKSNFKQSRFIELCKAVARKTI